MYFDIQKYDIDSHNQYKVHGWIKIYTKGKDKKKHKNGN